MQTPRYTTKSIFLILDPNIFEISNLGFLNTIRDFIEDLSDLRQNPTPIHVQLGFPHDLANQAQVNYYRIAGFNESNIPEENKNPFMLDQRIEGINDLLKQGDFETTRIVDLLGKAHTSKADGIITNSRLLQDSRYAIYQYHNQRIILLSEISDLLETFSRGFSLFWSSHSLFREYNLGTYYLDNHFKAKRYFQLFSKLNSISMPDESTEDFRNLLLNRTAMILYARDMFQFYALQRSHFSRREYLQPFVSELGYHLNTFYLLLWGGLDHLAVIANKLFALKLKPTKCGILSTDFWKVVNQAALKSFIYNHPIKPWLDLMANYRHSAAHQLLHFPGVVLKDSGSLKMSDDEVKKILRNEDPDFYQLPVNFIAAMEPTKVFDYKLRHAEVEFRNVVQFVDRKTGKKQMMDPTINIDFDLERYFAVMDPFLIALLKGYF